MASKKKMSKKKMRKKKQMKRPSMGSGIAEGGAKTIEKRNQESESRMDKLRKEMGMEPAKRNTGYRSQKK